MRSVAFSAAVKQEGPFRTPFPPAKFDYQTWVEATNNKSLRYLRETPCSEVIERGLPSIRLAARRTASMFNAKYKYYKSRALVFGNNNNESICSSRSKNFSLKVRPVTYNSIQKVRSSGSSYLGLPAK